MAMLPGGMAPRISRAIMDWARPGGPAGFNAETAPTKQDLQVLAEAIFDVIAARSPEIRALAQSQRDNKALRRELGRMGDKVYQLRCELTEARSHTMVDRTEVRGLRDRLRSSTRVRIEQGKHIKELEAEVEELKQKLYRRQSLERSVALAEGGYAVGSLEADYHRVLHRLA